MRVVDDADSVHIVAADIVLKFPSHNLGLIQASYRTYIVVLGRNFGIGHIHVSLPGLIGPSLPLPAGAFGDRNFENNIVSDGIV